jgi:hypothetical protein
VGRILKSPHVTRGWAEENGQVAHRREPPMIAFVVTLGHQHDGTGD